MRRAVLCRAVSSGTAAVVTCLRTGDAQFPAAFTVTIVASAGSATCGSSRNYTTVVSSTCCVSGATYARNATRSTCLSNLGCPAAGFVNNATASGSTNYPLVYGDCNTVTSTGTVAVSCTGTTTATVAFGVPVQALTTGGSATRYFYAGCGAPTSADSKCLPTAGFGAPSCSNTAVAACGGVLSGARTVVLNCTCASVRWIVASVPNTPAMFTGQRVDGACLL